MDENGGRSRPQFRTRQMELTAPRTSYFSRTEILAQKWCTPAPWIRRRKTHAPSVGESDRYRSPSQPIWEISLHHVPADRPLTNRKAARQSSRIVPHVTISCRIQDLTRKNAYRLAQIPMLIRWDHVWRIPTGISRCRTETGNGSRGRSMDGMGSRQRRGWPVQTSSADFHPHPIQKLEGVSQKLVRMSKSVRWIFVRTRADTS